MIAPWAHIAAAIRAEVTGWIVAFFLVSIVLEWADSG